MAPAGGNRQLSDGWVIGGAIAVVLVAGTLAWLAIPGPRASHDFTSPSGRLVLLVDEACEQTCNRRILLETRAEDGAVSSRQCSFAVSAAQPAFAEMSASWSADEQSVTLTYAGAESNGTIALELAQDCTLPE